MDEDLKLRLTGYLDALETTITDGKDFVVSEAPEVARQYLSWYWWESALYIGYASLAILIVGLIWWRLVYHPPKSFDKEDRELAATFSTVLGSISVACCSVVIMVNFVHLIKVSVAPKVVLLEEIARLIQ